MNFITSFAYGIVASLLFTFGLLYVLLTFLPTGIAHIIFFSGCVLFGLYMSNMKEAGA